MSTRNILIGTILIVIIFGVVWLIFAKKYSTIPLTGESYNDQKSSYNNDAVKNKHNKFFEFFDTFRYEDGQVPPEIKFAYPGEGLIVFLYDLGKEDATYGVYDYKKDILYKGIGNLYPGGSLKPVAFVGRDKLLIYNIEDTNQGVKTNLSVRDFNGGVIKTILEGKQLYNVSLPVYGKILQIEFFDPKSEGKYVTYTLNTETLELSLTKQ